MAKSISRPNGPKLPRWALLTLLAALAVVTVIVVTVAATQARTASDNAGTVPPSVLPEPAPKPEPTEEPEPEAPAFVSPVAQRILAVSETDSDFLMRAWVGSCPDPAGALEVSVDGGASWQSGVIASVDARRLLSLAPTGDIVRFTSQAGPDCETLTARSFVAGTSWEADPEPPVIWFIDPANSTVVSTPAGTQTLPCEVVGLSAASTRGIALCNDATVMVSEDDGASWSSPLAVPNAVAVGTVAGGFAVASYSEADCVGTQTRAILGGVLSEPGGCIVGVGSTDGTTAIAGGGSAWMLWAGDSMWFSNDAGSTWGEYHG